MSKANIDQEIRILVEHAMLTSPGAVIVHECPNCRTRYPFNVENITSVENMIGVIKDIMNASDYNRIAVLQAIGSSLASESEQS